MRELAAGRLRLRRQSSEVRVELGGVLLDGYCGAVQILGMKALSNFVSLHPYFKVHPGKREAFKAGFAAFVEKTGNEERNLFYEFTVNGDEVFCREAYTDAEGLLTHLDNVGPLLTEA